jgi:hypothetical protein
MAANKKCFLACLYSTSNVALGRSTVNRGCRQETLSRLSINIKATVYFSPLLGAIHPEGANLLGNVIKLFFCF